MKCSKMLNHYNIRSTTGNLFCFYTYTFIIISCCWCLLAFCCPFVSFFINAEETTILPIKLHGLNYNTRKGPDWDPNKCKSIDEVINDLKVLNRITNRIRLLSLTDCNQGEIVLNAIQQGNIDMSLWLGMWVSNDATVFEQELSQLNNMISSNVLPSSNVLGITVGSETIYRGEVTADQIINNCNAVKQLLSTSGIVNIPVAIVDIVSIYQRDTDLYLATDVIAVNVFQFFEKLDVNIAVNLLVNGTMPIVWDVANKMNKEVLLAETGWSSQGSNSIASDATPENQARYFQDFYCHYDILVKQKYQYYYFTSIDTDWRLSQDKDQNSAEGHFGLFYSNLTLKSHFQDLLFSCGEDSIKYRFDIDSSGSDVVSAALKNDSTPSPLMQFAGTLTPIMRPTLSDQITKYPISTYPTPSPFIGFTDAIAPTIIPNVSDQISIKPTRVLGASPARPTSFDNFSGKQSSSDTIRPSIPDQFTISPTMHMTTNAVTHSVAYKNTSCSSNQYCVSLSGNCCPTDNMEYLSCCSSTTSAFTTEPTASPTLDETTSSFQATLTPTNQLEESTTIPTVPMKLSNREIINATNPKDSSRTENPSDMITNTTLQTEVPSDVVSYDDTTDRNVNNVDITNDPKSEADPIRSITDTSDSNSISVTQRMLPTTVIAQIVYTFITIPSIITIILLVI